MDEPPPGAPGDANAPVDVDGVRTVTAGTVLWLVALGVMLLFRDRLEENGTIWWLWTCVAGVGLGLLGIDYTRRRRAAIRRVRDYKREHPDAAGGA